MIEYAKKNSNVNLVFRPHPLTFNNFIEKKLMTKKEVNDIVSNIINSFADLKEKRLENQSLYNFSLGQSSIKRLDGGIYNGSLALNFTVKQI